MAPTPAAIERAAAAAAISPPALVHATSGGARRSVAAPPRPAPQSVVAPAGADLGLDDLPAVSSADWAAMVGEAAKMVDVVVVFYTAANVEWDMFKQAFRSVVNEVLPRLGRPYTVYRFSLDAEPGFVPEMAASLGLPPDNPVTAAGFAWAGPGRRLFVLGDRALGSAVVFQRSLRLSLQGQPAQLSDERVSRQRQRASFESPRERTGRPWAGRVLAGLAWCLFGTAALGAAVVGIAPKWTGSLLHSTSLSASGPSPSADDPARLGKSPLESTHSDALPPTVSPDESAGTPVPGAAQTQTKSAKPPNKHAKRKQTANWLSFNPYWGLPNERNR